MKIYHKQLSQWYDPKDIFVSLFGKEAYSFWLDGTGRFSYMGDVSGSLAKKIKYKTAGQELEIREKQKTKTLQKSVFAYLKQQLVYSSGFIVNSKELPFDFIGGFVGYFGYELYKEMDSRLPRKGTSFFEASRGNDKKEFPDAYFFFVDRFLAFDNKEKKIYLVCISESEKEAGEWFGEIENREGIIGSSSSPEGEDRGEGKAHGKQITFKLSRDHEQYLQDIEICKEYLRNGESYQICLTNQITADVQVDWLELYLHLRTINPAPYSTYMRFGDFAILSSSPEQFLKIDTQRNISSKPIKGTVKRGKTPEEDKRLADNLGKTEKDFAENSMIVDLVRNDLGKVCKIGTIRVPKLLVVETYSTVHQLVSTITGTLREDVSVIDAIQAAFPPGSMTGAPKIRAMEILAELEKQPRGIYSGALGFLSLNGTVDLSVVIRTIIATKNKLSLGVGGAILLQSDPESEYNEMLLKAKAMRKAIEDVSSIK